MAKPLHELTSGENANKKKKEVQWQMVHQDTFEKLKQKMTESPVLAYADYTKPFRVYTDASERGLGAVLAQEQDQKEPAIAFASRSLSKAEKRYDAHKLEFLALKWAITDRFHEYLYRGTFEVYTDNNPLTYILTTAKLDATGQRWVAALALYNFKLFYRSGRSNANADALSRIPWDYIGKEDLKELSKEEVRAMMCHSNGNEIPQETDDIISKAAHFFAPDYVPMMTGPEWKQLQKDDETIRRIIDLIEDGKIDTYRVQKSDNHEM